MGQPVRVRVPPRAFFSKFFLLYLLSPLTSLAKSLRKKSTRTENDLWYYLKSKRFHRLKFRRQHPIGTFIVDFVCLEKKVVIELDGGQHLEQSLNDQQRDKWLKEEGYEVLRFWNHQFYQNREEVLEKIWNACNV